MSKLIRSLAEANKIGGLNPDSGFKNYIINGGFDVWQRGTSFTVGNNVRIFNMFLTYSYVASAALLYEKVDANLDGFSNAIHIDCPSGVTTVNMGCKQRIEFGDKLLDGKTFVVSFRAKSSKDTTSKCDIWLNGLSTKYTTISNPVISNTYQRYSFLCSPSTYGAAISGTTGYTEILIGLRSSYAADRDVTITGFQLELGEVATDFEYRPYGLELSLCQRQLEVIDMNVGDRYTFSGFYRSNTTVIFSLPFKAIKRIQPTISLNTGAEFFVHSNQLDVIGTLSYIIAGPFNAQFVLTVPDNGIAGQGCIVTSNVVYAPPTPIITISAEL